MEYYYVLIPAFTYFVFVLGIRLYYWWHDSQEEYEEWLDRIGLNEKDQKK